MKKIYTFFILVLLTASAFCQAPGKMSYQAVIRDADNKLVTDQTIDMQISILQGSLSGTPVYVEIQQPTTNTNGLVSIEIGSGTTNDDFSSINWSNGPFFIKIETDPAGGTNYSVTGTSQLLSVPYAFHAKATDNFGGLISESQISDLNHFTNADETDPVYGASVASDINETDTIYWNNKLDEYIETDPIWVADSVNYYTRNNLQSADQAEIHWNNVVSLPTTLDGYGITDAAYVDHTHNVVTPSSNGFMSAEDKTRLDELKARDYVGGEGIVVSGNEISADLELAASLTGDTLMLNPGNYLFVPGLSNANADLPVVTTGEVTNITSHKAYGHGKVTYYGDSAIIESGVCWSENLSPTTEDNFVSGGPVTGDIICVMEGLTENTNYFVRAYSKTASATFYGENVMFTTTDVIPVPTVSTTEVTGITETTALSGGFISADGGAEVTARGVCWNTSPAPTIDHSKTTNGTGTGLFTSYISGLTLNTEYYIRAYATNANGTNYGSELIFRTDGDLPVVNTASPQSVTTNRAVLGGEVTDEGSATVTERGICFGTSSNPKTSGNKVAVGTGTGSFSTVDAILLPNTTYYVRAYATNSVGIAYGGNQTFTTSNAYYEGFEDGFPGGNTGGWGIVSNKSYEGYFALYTRQGGATASITRDLSEGGEIKFFLYTGKDIYYTGSVTFLIDDIEIATIYSDNNWLNYSYTVSPGIHTFKWKFNPSGNRAAWLDYIIMPE